MLLKSIEIVSIIFGRFYWFDHDSFVDKRCSFVRQRTSTIVRARNQQYDKSQIFSITDDVPKRNFADNLPQFLTPKNHYTFLIKVSIGCMNEIARSVSAQRVHQGSGMFSSIMAVSVFLQIVLICLVFKRLSSLPYMEVVNSNFRRIFCWT